MIARCANPDCGATFRMWKGKVFHFDHNVVDQDGRSFTVTDHFWLCGECLQSLTLEWTDEGLILRACDEAVAAQPQEMVTA